MKTILKIVIASLAVTIGATWLIWYSTHSCRIFIIRQSWREPHPVNLNVPEIVPHPPIVLPTSTN